MQSTGSSLPFFVLLGVVESSSLHHSELPVATQRRRAIRRNFERRIVEVVGSLRTTSSIEYPFRFKIFLAMLGVLSFFWLTNYSIRVLPTIEENTDAPCMRNNSRLAFNVRMVFVFFLWFVAARVFFFAPCIAVRVAQVQRHTHGFCVRYCTALFLRDGPIYCFLGGSLLLGWKVTESPVCERSSPELHSMLRSHATFSCLVSFFFLAYANWHNKLLNETRNNMLAAAPPSTLAELRTLAYDPALFGDEEGRTYGAECTICLLSFEPTDAIKGTPCAHAFHEECLARWLQTATTCPLCRRDMGKPTQAEDLEVGHLQASLHPASSVSATADASQNQSEMVPEARTAEPQPGDDAPTSASLTGAHLEPAVETPAQVSPSQA